jgi:chromosome segregation ATPase
MADDKTQHFGNSDSFEERVLAQLAAIDARLNTMEQRFDERLSSLEAKVDDRLRETRPIWEKALAEIMAVGEQLKATDSRVAETNDRLAVIAEEFLAVKGKQHRFDARLREIEEDRQPH